MAKAHLNGAQDMLALFGLMPIYDRAVRPYNPETIRAAESAAAAALASSDASGSRATAAAAAAASGVGAASSGYVTHAPSSGIGSTPVMQLNGGPPTFSLPTDSSALLGASPGQVAASAAAAPPVKKPTKPPPTYAHYVQDLAGRVRPQRKAARAAKADKGTSLVSILHKPEYTPQRIVPFDAETITTAFKVESGSVAEIDQALLEPDEEEQPRKKKRKKPRDEQQR